MHQFLEVFVTHKEAFGTLIHPTRVEECLSAYPLASVLRVFSRIMHNIEQGGDRLVNERRILRFVGVGDTIRLVEKEVETLQKRGSAPRIFTELTLLNFMKLAIRHCPLGDKAISRSDVDLLFRCYLATQDHFPPQRATRPSGKSKAFTRWVEQDLIRQSLMVGEAMELLLPRYWSLWVTIPAMLGKQGTLRSFLPAPAPQDIRTGFVVALTLWAYWNGRAQDLSAPAMLRRQYWDGHPQVGSDIESWLRELSLPGDEFKREMEREWLQLGREEHWEYSFLSVQKWPLIWIGEDLYCLSLRGLIRRVTDGVYYRMLTACEGDEKRVNDLTRLFGEFFHVYIHDLWQRVSEKKLVRRVMYQDAQKEAGDGLIQDGSDLIIYDAKSTRFRLPTIRTGKLTDVSNDLQRGVVQALQQLGAVIADIKASRVPSLSPTDYATYYPVVVTATPFPGIPSAYRFIDADLIKQARLDLVDIAPFQIIDTEGLELLEGAKSIGMDPIGFLKQRALNAEWTTIGIKNLLHLTRGQAPRNPRMKSGFIGLLDAVKEWLETGNFGQDKVDRLISPPLD